MILAIARFKEDGCINIEPLYRNQAIVSTNCHEGKLDNSLFYGLTTCPNCKSNNALTYVKSNSLSKYNAWLFVSIPYIYVCMCVCLKLKINLINFL